MSTSTTVAPAWRATFASASWRHAVERGLHILGQLVGIALAVQPHLDAGARGEALELSLEGGHEAVVVERRGAQVAGEVEQLLHRLVDEPLQLGDLIGPLRRASWASASSRSRIAVRAWLTSS